MKRAEPLPFKEGQSISPEEEKMRLIQEALKSAFTFGAMILGTSFYDWQAKILQSCSRVGMRRKIAVRAPNGAGKDDRIIAPLALWWIRRFPKGRVVITSRDAHQMKDQTWKAISSHKNQYADCKWVDSEYRITTPEGGWVSGFTTDEAARAEGYHFDNPTEFRGPLLMIVNEAKSVPDEIFDAFDRCTYNVLLEISTGGLKEGRFFEHFTSKSENYEKHHISLLDCPHIPKEKIEQTIAEYGEHDPHTRSTLFGEFMESDDEVRHVFEESAIESNQAAHIEDLQGAVVVGMDFAGGGDQNVFIYKTGNFVPSGCLKAWRERDTMAAVGRMMMYLHEYKVSAEEVWADSTGLGQPMCDAMAEAGQPPNRINFSEASPDPRYKDIGSYLWHETAKKVRMHQIKVPRHPLLIQQLLSRRTKYHSSGKVWIESKDDMLKRKCPSPDLADAFCIAFGIQPVMQTSWLKKDGNRYADISRHHGWDYSGGDEEERIDGRPGRGEEGGNAFDFLNSH